MRLLEKIYKWRGKTVPYYAKYPLWLIVWKPFRKWINVVFIPNIPFNNLRVLLYKMIGYRIGKGVFIGMKCYLDDLNPSHMLIEDNVTISYGCYFSLHGKKQDHRRITIGEGTYLGMRCSISATKTDINIGKNCRIGAGSLVLNSIPSYSVAVGVPARVVRKVGT